jgi:hypothetical protein
LASISGQDWFPETLTNGTRFTSVENTPRQELTIPIGYPNPAGIVAELTAEE